MQGKWSKQKAGYANQEATTSREPANVTVTVRMFAATKVSPVASATVTSTAAAATVLSFAREHYIA